MVIRYRLLFLSVLMNAQWCFGQTSTLSQAQRQHVEVSMRMIGHQVLLSLGDSTSRVLPIESDENRYRIKFESEFAFNPDDLSAVVDSVIAETAIASDYIVEVLSCDSGLVVHSYEKNSEVGADVLACRGRDQPKACYNLRITILDTEEMGQEPILVTESDDDTSNRTYVWLGLIAVAILGGIVFLSKRKAGKPIDPNVIAIGKFRFKRNNMELWFNDEKIELTSKECDLLQLLCDSTNDTVERETILRMVWGDEGDYVGRTLDVFISKLRKKLEADSNVRIVNIRGIGYKLVLNE